MEENVSKSKPRTAKPEAKKRQGQSSCIRMCCSMVALRGKDQCETLAVNTGQDQKDRIWKKWARIRFEIRHSWLEGFAKILRRN